MYEDNRYANEIWDEFIDHLVEWDLDLDLIDGDVYLEKDDDPWEEYGDSRPVFVGWPIYDLNKLIKQWINGGGDCYALNFAEAKTGKFYEPEPDYEPDYEPGCELAGCSRNKLWLKLRALCALTGLLNGLSGFFKRYGRAI